MVISLTDHVVGIISWLIYFLLDNKSLSVFTESSTKQNLSLASKAKLHLTISNTLNDSKKLNSIIARALDEISEEINLTNNLASIIIDDSIVSHSIVIRSKKYDKTNAYTFGKSYGGQFHFDIKGLGKKRILAMDGFGGQQIIIDIDNNKIIVINSIYNHYNWKKIVYKKLKNK